MPEEPGGRRVSIAITVAVLLVVIAVGVVTFDQVKGTYQEQNEALENRAEERYGDEYRIVQSSECWDVCVSTATSVEQQKEDILYTLKQRGGYVSKWELSTSTVGMSLSDAAIADLSQNGKIDRKQQDGVFGKTLYRYTGTDSEVSPISDAELRDRVEKRLYITGSSMTAQAIARDLPVGQYRVKTALRQLEDTGAVDDGYVIQQLFSEHMWIHTDHGTLPNGIYHQYGLVGPLGLVIVSVFVVGLIQRVRVKVSKTI